MNSLHSIPTEQLLIPAEHKLAYLGLRHEFEVDLEMRMHKPIDSDGTWVQYRYAHEDRWSTLRTYDISYWIDIARRYNLTVADYK